MDENNLDVDFSWIHEQEKLQNIQDNFHREPMEFIYLKYIYINQNNYINKVLSERFYFDAENQSEGGSLQSISQEHLLHIIQSNKIVTPTTIYKFKDVILYNVDLEPEHIQSYSKNDNFVEFSSSFFKVLSILNKITIPNSIFIFHKINCLYFIFQEVEINKLKKPVLKSILKSENDIREPGISISKKNTKKVRISNGFKNNDKNGEPLNMARKTRRRLKIDTNVDKSI